MKIAKFLLLLIASCIYILSCSNDLDLNAPYKTIPIVYGVLSNKDTTHYIRIQKAYNNPEGDATQFAQVIDSIYYKDEDILVQLVDKNLKTWTLRRVDGNLEGYKRESGVFANSPNYLYKIKGDSLRLDGGEKVKLTIIDRKTNTVLGSAETQISKSMRETTTAIPSEINFLTNLPNLTNTLNWEFDPATVRFFNARMFLNIDETDPADPNKLISKKIPWQLVADFDAASSFVAGTRASIKYPTVEFYKVIRDNLDPNLNVKRYFRTIEVEINGANNDLYQYLNASTVNTGITSAEVIPNYSNIKNGYGVFASRTKLTKGNIKIKTETNDSLRFGSITKAYNFQ